MVRGRFNVSRSSIQNLCSELRGLCLLVKSIESVEEKNETLESGMEEILYNISLLEEGVEYVSDEFQYLADRVREV